MENMIIRKAELVEMLSDFHDDDVVVVEVHDTTLNEDLYSFYIDSVDCMGLGNGRSEIRICPVPMADPYTRAERAAKAFVNHKAFDEGNVKVFIEVDQQLKLQQQVGALDHGVVYNKDNLHQHCHQG